MKKSIWFPLAFIMTFALTAPLAAQQAQPPLWFGVLDMPSIIKVHPITVDSLPLIQQSAQKNALAFEEYKKTYNKQVQQLQQQYKLGTPQFEEAVKPLNDSFRQAQNDAQDQLNKITGEVSKLEYQVYQDIQKAVETVAGQKGIIFVQCKVRMDRQGVTEEVAAVQELMGNMPLVWNRSECDITEDVKATLLQITGPPKTAGALNNISGQVSTGVPGAPQSNPAQTAARPTSMTGAAAALTPQQATRSARPTGANGLR